MAVGDQMVKELKHNKQLDWKFVSPSKAKYGMSHRKYYTVITIPKNFSKNATTVLDKNPKPMNLKYQTNDSLNYIGYVMSQVAMTRLNEKIRANVTNAYATTMFKELKVLGKGMTQAADGVQTLRMGVAPLAAGAQQLASGSTTLANGIAQYTGGVGQLATGLNTLMANSGQLNSGAGQLSSGLNTLRNNSGSLRAGSSQLSAGASQLNNTVNSQLGNLPVNDLMGAMDKAQALQQSMTQLQTGLTQAKSALAGVQESAGKLESAAGSLSGVSQAGQQLGNVARSDANIAAQLGKIAQSTSDNSIKAQLGSLAQDAGNNAKTLQGVGTALGELNSLGSALQGMQGQLKNLSSMNDLLNNADTTISQANG